MDDLRVRKREVGVSGISPQYFRYDRRGGAFPAFQMEGSVRARTVRISVGLQFLGPFRPKETDAMSKRRTETGSIHQFCEGWHAREDSNLQPAD